MSKLSKFFISPKLYFKDLLKKKLTKINTIKDSEMEDFFSLNKPILAIYFSEKENLSYQVLQWNDVFTEVNKTHKVIIIFHGMHGVIKNAKNMKFNKW